MRTMRKLRSLPRSENGMSLIELIIAVSILFIMLTGVLFFFDFGFKNFKMAQSKSVLSQDSDSIMEKMIRQIRVASKFQVPTGSGWDTNFYPICFQGDILGDGNTWTTTFYKTSDNQLIMNSVNNGTTNTTTLTTRVTALRFNYYDSSSAALGTVSQTKGTDLSSISDLTTIKTVQISLTMSRQVAGGGTVSTTRTGTVVIRAELTSIEPVSDREIRIG